MSSCQVCVCVECFYDDNPVKGTPPQAQDSVKVFTTNLIKLLPFLYAVRMTRWNPCSVLFCPCVLCYSGYPAVSCIFLHHHDMQDSIHDNPQHYRMSTMMLCRRNLEDFLWIRSHMWCTERFEIKISVDWLHVMDIPVHRILLAFQLIIHRETNMIAHKNSQDNTAVFLCIYVDL